MNIPDTAPFVISCSADKDGQSVSSDIVIDGTNYGKLTFDYSVDYNADIDIPDKGGAFMIDMDSEEAPDFEEYASKDEFNSFMQGLLTKAGIDSKYADKYAEAITEEVYDELDYGSIDFDDDDFDFDDDDDDDFDFDDDDDDYDDFDFQFDPDSFKYEDYKDYMTEEEFNEMMDNIKKYYDEYESSSSKAN